MAAWRLAAIARRGAFLAIAAAIACWAMAAGPAVAAPSVSQVATAAIARSVAVAGDRGAGQPTESRPAIAAPAYGRCRPSSDGIGKTYLGREIARVMGYRGAAWLERPSREREERLSRALDDLALPPDAVVADLGAGTGYASFRLAARLPEGRVLAADVQPEMVDILRSRAESSAIANLEPILGAPDDPKLPAETVDWAIAIDAYHEFEFPFEMMQGVRRSLKPGGRVVLVEYRAENPFIFIKRHHKMSLRQMKREMAVVGLVWERTSEVLPQQHVAIFRKPLD